MSTLKISLLGSPEVDHRDHRLAFPERKVLALLAYLASEGGMHERHKLTHLLWPESDMAHGRTALRIALLHLRHILEEDASLEHEPHLLITHDTIGIDLVASIDLDLHALESAWKLVCVLPAPEAVQGEVRRVLITQLYRVAALYRGSFLQDFTLRETLDFDNWLGMQQGYWYQRIEQVFDWLSQFQNLEGELEQAIETVERWRSFDPLNEDISLRLMQLQFVIGNRIAALKTFETYQDVLMTELSAKPSRKLVVLAEVVRNSSPPRSVHCGVGSCASDLRPLLDIPFVGRGTEFSRLLRLYERTSNSQPQVVLLEGEAGIGKTCLAAAFLDWARAQGAALLEGRAFKSYQRLSYQPLLDPLRTMLEQEPDLRQLLSTTWLAELSRLLPELCERYPDLPPTTLYGVFASTHLFEALARLLQAFAERAPLLIFVDDLQWADAETLDVFQYLARYWREHSAPAMLLLGMRKETREMEPEMSEWLANLKNTISLTRLELGSLSAKDTLQIVHSLSYSRSGDMQGEGEQARFQLSSQQNQTSGSNLCLKRFGEWLFSETKGQPYYLKALLQTLLERGALVPRLIAESGWIFEPQLSILDATSPDNILPTNVREMIQRRLARLSFPTRTLLAAGAVLEQDFTFEDLCQVAQFAPQEGLIALDEALQNLLLHESRHQREGSKVSYRFSHDKIRDVVYAAAGDARRRVFHSRALMVLAHAVVPTGDQPSHELTDGAAALTFQ